MSASDAEIAALADFLRGAKTVVITGAGVSTDAGLPDYRGAGGTEDPSIDYDMFLSSPSWRRWVWQRNQETWQALDALEPPKSQKILADWEERGLITGVATQNVDGLHEKAGTKNLAQMHGTFRRVVCLDCQERFVREDIDVLLRELNPDVNYDSNPAHAAILASADRAAAGTSTFKVAPCPKCQGVLKPDIVFFGEQVQDLDPAFEFARAADKILVLGTSLVVLTGLWVMQEAWSRGAQLAIVNRGPTQADGFAHLRLEGDVDDILTRVDQLL